MVVFAKFLIVGLLSVFMVLRTPYHAPRTLLAQLHPYVKTGIDTVIDDQGSAHLWNGDKIPVSSETVGRFFYMPPEVEKSHCRL